MCCSLHAHRCYTAVCSEEEKMVPPVSLQEGSSLGKIPFTHKALMCLCEQVCVCVRQKWKVKQKRERERERDRERDVLQRKQSRQHRPEIGSGRTGNWGPLRTMRGFRSVYKCVCVCGGGVTTALSSGCAQTVCVFGADLIQLLESQTQSVHPDVDRCAARNMTSTETCMHSTTNTQTKGRQWHISFLYPLWRQSWLAGMKYSTNTTAFPKTNLGPRWRCYVHHCVLPDVLWIT